MNDVYKKYDGSLLGLVFSLFGADIKDGTDNSRIVIWSEPEVWIQNKRGSGWNWNTLGRPITRVDWALPGAGASFQHNIVHVCTFGKVDVVIGHHTEGDPHLWLINEVVESSYSILQAE